jgi:diacylglycerol kinase family enzyme
MSRRACEASGTLATGRHAARRSGRFVTARPPPAVLAQDAPIFVVLNAGSGRTGADERIETLRRVFDEARRPVNFLPVEQPRYLRAIATRAAAQARAHDGVLVAAGGDGTLNVVAQAAIEQECRFGALPQGTFNYFGRAHGISQDTETAARALLRATETPVQVGSVNGRVFLVNASLGLYSRLLEDREAYKRQLGRSRWVAMLSGLATLLREHRQLDLVIENGGELKRLRTPTLFVGNNPLQFEQIGLDDAVQTIRGGELVALAVKPTGTAALLGLALRGVIGRLGDASQLQCLSLRRLTVRSRSHRRLRIATDGELQWAQLPLVFEVSPRPLRLLQPRPEDRVEPA